MIRRFWGSEPSSDFQQIMVKSNPCISVSQGAEQEREARCCATSLPMQRLAVCRASASKPAPGSIFGLRGNFISCTAFESARRLGTTCSIQTVSSCRSACDNCDPKSRDEERGKTMITCDLCGEAKDCLQREIESKEYDICSECWKPLEQKLRAITTRFPCTARSIRLNLTPILGGSRGAGFSSPSRSFKDGAASSPKVPDTCQSPRSFLASTKEA